MTDFSPGACSAISAAPVVTALKTCAIRFTRYALTIYTGISRPAGGNALSTVFGVLAVRIFLAFGQAVIHVLLLLPAAFEHPLVAVLAIQTAVLTPKNPTLNIATPGRLDIATVRIA